ncbi:MAG: RNA pyrophosphohydrolase [Spirochaetota bacterium]
MAKPYRKCAGIVIFNANGDVLVGNRIQTKQSWQFPQGGIDPGETAEQAGIRELYEEVGIQNATLVYEHPNWLFYDFPDWLKGKKINKFQGQTQKWFLFYWNGQASDCNLEIHEREFSEVKFVPLKSTIHLVIDFKREVYASIIESFSPKIEGYLNNTK